MKRQLILIVLLAFFHCGAEAKTASVYSGEKYSQYIEKYADTAVSEMKRTGVPASITLAQGLLESGAGQSVLAVKGNNHFGIKCHNDWTGRKMYKDDDAKNECFRVYPSAEASFKDHSDFLRYKDRYKPLFELKPTDYKGWARGLKKAGYATSPTYAESLIRIIEENELYKYDKKEDYIEVVEVPVSPNSLEKPVRYKLTREYNSANGVPFVYSVASETYASIAKSYDLFLKELLRYNDLSAEEPLAKGTIVYIQPKKNRAAKGVDKYVVGKNGESLWAISQRFGIKLSSLVRMNKLAPDYVPSEGDMLKLR